MSLPLGDIFDTNRLNSYEIKTFQNLGLPYDWDYSIFSPAEEVEVQTQAKFHLYAKI